MRHLNKALALALSSLCLLAAGCEGPPVSQIDFTPSQSSSEESFGPLLTLTTPSFGPEQELYVAVASPDAQPGDAAVGFVNKQGKIVIGPQYYDAYDFTQGLAAVETEEGWVYINTNGERQFGTAFAEAHPFAEDRAVVTTLEGVRGVIALDGKSFALPNAVYTDTRYYEGMLLVSLEDRDLSHYTTQRYGYVDKDGSLAIEPRFSRGDRFGEGLAAVRMDDGSLAYINKTGEVVLQTIYVFDMANSDHYFSDGLARVCDRVGKEGFINTSGQIIVPCSYDKVHPFSEGLASASIGGSYGFVSTEAFVIIPMEFDEAGSFSEGLAPVYKKNPTSGAEPEYYVGFVNPQGELVVDYEYAYHYSSHNAFCPGYQMKNGLINVYYIEQTRWNPARWFGYINGQGEPVYQSVPQEQGN